ncbi:unnamed protein product [Dicrocoelium dendriticum]|nr:unnamed protein product [Dicrocoelium dendriticum]
MSDLPSIFSEALKKHDEVTNFIGSHSSPKFESIVKEACKLCERCISMVNDLELFSKNETMDDLTSTEIRYLVLPSVYGYFLSQRNDDRLNNIRIAIYLYKEFFQLCASYDVYKQKSGALSTDTDLTSAMASRTAKIQRYKERKVLEERLASLADSVDQPHVDEDVKREYNLLFVRHWASLAEDQLQTLVQEERLLSVGPEQLEETRKSPPPSSLRPFILTRSAMQAAVFGAGYPSVPTMTVDAFYDYQIRRGFLPPPERTNRSGNLSPSVVRIDPSEAELAAAEEKAARADEQEDADDPSQLAKARNWDEFKDEHRRGSGNRINRA